MSNEVYVALIAAFVSVLSLIWNLATARINRKLVLSAEEIAKRGELVRVKALEAIDSVLEAIAEMVSVVGGLQFLVKNAGGVSMEIESVREGIKNFAEKRSSVMKLRIRCAPYLTEYLIAEMDDLFAQTESLNVNLQALAGVEVRLKSIGEAVANDARRNFLETSSRAL